MIAVHWLCLPALMVAAACGLTTETLGPKALDVFVLLATALFIAFGASLRNSFVVRLFGLALLIQLASWGYSHLFHPEFAESSPKLNRMAPWFIMIPVAFVLKGSTRLSYLLIGAVIAGAFAAPWLSGNGWQEIKQGISGSRIDFSINNAQHAALLYSTSFIAVTTLGIFAARALRKHYALAIPALSLLALMIAFVIAMLQTRASWLGLCAAGITFGLCILVLYRKGNPGNNTPAATNPTLFTALLPLVLFGSLALFIFSEQYERRLDGLKDGPVEALIAGNLRAYLEKESSYQQHASEAIRLAYWYEAGERLAEKPLLGWGGKGRKLAADNADLIPPPYRETLHHLHNSFLDTAVNYGYTGLLLLVILQLYVIYMAHSAWKAGKLPTGFLVFTYSFISYWLVINLFESYFYYSSGTLIFGIVAGIVLSHYWRRDISHTEPEKGPHKPHP